MTKNLTLLSIILSSILTSTSSAQNTGGVFDPSVNDGHKSFQYRASIDPDNANSNAGFAQRLHYQQSINDDFMWRLVGQTRKTGSSNVDFDYVQGELFWQIHGTDDYKSGLRFDLRTRDNDRPEPHRAQLDA